MAYPLIVERHIPRLIGSSGADRSPVSVKILNLCVAVFIDASMRHRIGWLSAIGIKQIHGFIAVLLDEVL